MLANILTDSIWFQQLDDPTQFETEKLNSAQYIFNHNVSPSQAPHNQVYG